MRKSSKQDGRPSIQFYPGDVLNESTLELVSLEAAGAAYFLLMHMIRSPKRGGLLKANGEIPTTNNIAKWLGVDEAKTKQLVAELLVEEVYSRADDGMIYNRRLWREWQISQARAEAGRKGGLKAKNKAKQPPSSSSSVSSSSSTPLTPQDGGNQNRRRRTKEERQYDNEKVQEDERQRQNKEAEKHMEELHQQEKDKHRGCSPTFADVSLQPQAERISPFEPEIPVEAVDLSDAALPIIEKAQEIIEKYGTKETPQKPIGGEMAPRGQGNVEPIM